MNKIFYLKDLWRTSIPLKGYNNKTSLSLHWVNSEGVIIWANQTELDLLGYTPNIYFYFDLNIPLNSSGV